ncbi:MAG: Asp-tRNA(Asn)/Glu-tRNA(Gln) amidotransferase subunit GatC [Erysipelotrichaceae bacterium]|nr:Asp-tRNA(Asn)/Glu-tRNA(Gln) amidotransferase subunit GatC [Erysipelotrichaceae bacterium]MBQ7890102.1 Asp-tRNA(Asn)/Glu-tRNA(Gln) amidotransferase subunit GatC [Erysipelotrichaceae bacterium]
MEEIKDQAYFKALARKLMFELTDEEADDIVQEFKTLCVQLQLLEAIDTTGVEPMVYPFETPTVYLREDEENHTISQEEALSNASKVVQGHFSVPRVVK